MKTFIYLTLFLLIFSCRKDTSLADIKPASVIETEDWKTLDDETIFLTDRNILSSNATSNKLFLQSPNTFYTLDSSLKRINSNSSEGPGYDDGFNRIGTGNNFSLYLKKIYPNYLYMRPNNKEVYANSGAGVSLKDSTNTNYSYSYFSNLDENDNFCLGYYIGNNNGIGDSNFFYIKKFHASAVPYNYIKCEAVYNKFIKKETSGYPDNNNGNLFIINDVIYYGYYGLGFRFEYPNKIDTIKFNLLKMIKINNVIYATSGYDNSLYSSTDNGINWQKAGINGSFYNAKDLSNIDNKLLMYHFDWIGFLDFSNGTVKLINTKQIHAQIKTVTQFRDKVIVGTDAGVYYKSVKHFFAD